MRKYHIESSSKNGGVMDMKMRTSLITVLLGTLLFSACAYGQELTEREKQIFYDGSELELSITQEMLSQNNETIQLAEMITRYGITEEQLDDIVDRGFEMPLTAVEEEVAMEIKQKLFPLPLGPLSEADLRVMRDLSLKHGMRLGQVGSILVRILPEEKE